jgi:hypothetical protein
MINGAIVTVVTIAAFVLSIVVVDHVEAFMMPSNSINIARGSQRTSTTDLNFGFFPSSSDDDKDDNKDDPKLQKKSVGWKGLVQLITAGAGAPFLGDFEVSWLSGTTRVFADEKDFPINISNQQPNTRLFISHVFVCDDTTILFYNVTGCR